MVMHVCRSHSLTGLQVAGKGVMVTKGGGWGMMYAGGDLAHLYAMYTLADQAGGLKHLADALANLMGLTVLTRLLTEVSLLRQPQNAILGHTKA